VLERAMILASGELLHVEHLPPEIATEQSEGPRTPPQAAGMALPAIGLHLAD